MSPLTGSGEYMASARCIREYDMPDAINGIQGHVHEKRCIPSWLPTIQTNVSCDKFCLHSLISFEHLKCIA